MNKYPFSFNEAKHQRWVAQSYVRERFSQYRDDTRTDKSKTDRRITVNDMRNLAAEVVQKCEQIRNRVEYATTTVSSMSATEFESVTKSMQTARFETVNIVSLMSNTDIYNSLKMKMSKRSNKRMRLKRRKNCSMSMRNERAKLNKAKLEEVEQRLKRSEHDIKKNKMENEIKVKADEVLKDVNKRKSDAHKYISLLENLCKLREARVKTILGCGKAVSATETDLFLKSIEKLKTLWNDALTRYEYEKCELKMILDNDKASQSENSDNNVEGFWQNIMFGNKNFLSQQFDGDLIKHINIRMQWDKYICSDEKGSRIPIGWLFPVAAIEKWELFIKFKH